MTEKKSELIQSWKLEEGVSLRLYREERRQVVLRVYDESATTEDHLTDEISMRPSTAKSLGWALAKNADVSSASNGSNGLPRFTRQP